MRRPSSYCRRYSSVPQLEPTVERVLVALVQGLRSLDVRFCVVGALVPELLLNERPKQATLDADAIVFVPDLATFEHVKKGLHGFAPTKFPYRLRHESGGRADILPYSDELAPDGVLRLEPDYVFNMTGFDRVAGALVEVTLDSGERVPVVLVPGYVLLKLVAFTDRKLAKDIDGVLHCLRHYAADDDRRFGLEHDGVSVPYEYGSAYLLARDALPFLDGKLRQLIAPLLNSLIQADLDANDEESYERKENREYWRWFRTGLGL
jgi:predicted nucleotidyltransferase